MSAKVLIIGAGPSGLVTALTLNKFNIPFKIIDKEKDLSTESRAMGVVPGTLEHYSQLGIAKDLIKNAIHPDQIHFHTLNKDITFDFNQISVSNARFNYLYTYPQDEHESLLYETLKDRGEDVQWETELIDIIEEEPLVTVKLNVENVEKIEHFDYVIGADGGSSQVRNSLNLDFIGETNKELFFVSDVEIKEENFQRNDVHAFFKGGNFLLAFPLRNEKISRLIGLYPPSLAENNQTEIDQLISFFQEKYHFNIQKVHWFSEYKIHHRLAEHYRKGDVFLVGDAAHLHSPVGAQGMNAGIADAINLSWKLAHVIHGAHHPTILDTYEDERRAYAKKLIKTTDRGFKGIKLDHKWVNIIREKSIPILLNLVLNKSDTFKENLFGNVAQLLIQYKESPLNVGDSRLSGKRLPFYNNNSQLTDSMTWQLHVYGKIQSNLRSFLEKNDALDFHEIEWEEELSEIGFEENGAYLVRPDGYIAWTSITQDVQSLNNYINKWR